MQTDVASLCVGWFARLVERDSWSVRWRDASQLRADEQLAKALQRQLVAEDLAEEQLTWSFWGGMERPSAQQRAAAASRPLPQGSAASRYAQLDEYGEDYGDHVESESLEQSLAAGWLWMQVCVWLWVCAIIASGCG
jgi:hypothetical protein